MGIAYHFSSVTLSSGQHLSFSPNTVTCIVGANNEGKSRFLKDLVQLAGAQVPLGSNGDTTGTTLTVARSAHLTVSDFDPRDVDSWVQQNSIEADPHYPSGTRVFPPGQSPADRAAVTFAITSAKAGAGFQHLTDSFVRRIPAGGLTPYAAGELRTDSSPNSAHNWLLRRLLEDGELAAGFSSVLEQIFGIPCFIDRVHFPPRLRAGKIETEAPKLDSINSEYTEAVKGCPPLDDQGDGIRSFAGLALLVMAVSPRILLLDEPESFLHPAQARAVGRWLAMEARNRGMQVFVATHDRDFLSGLLSHTTTEVGILRMRRSEHGAKATMIESKDLQEFWSNPSLRYSNVLQGLFHRRVVICEGDVDCRFYAAAADAIASDQAMRHIADEALFVPSGGKNGIAKLGALLGRLGVATSAIVDFDALGNKDVIRSVTESLGQVWDSDTDAAWSDAMKHLPKTTQDRENFWKRSKNRGLSEVPAGPATTDFEALLRHLAALGVVVVPIGELEDLHRLSGKGPGWISAALEASAHLSEITREIVRAALPELSHPESTTP